MATYTPAFTPSPEVAQHPYPQRPVHTSLGMTALHRHRLAEFAHERDDIIAHPWDDDPRLGVETALEG